MIKRWQDLPGWTSTVLLKSEQAGTAYHYPPPLLYPRRKLFYPSQILWVWVGIIAIHIVTSCFGLTSWVTLVYLILPCGLCAQCMYFGSRCFVALKDAEERGARAILNKLHGKSIEEALTSDDLYTRWIGAELSKPHAPKDPEAVNPS